MSLKQALATQGFKGGSRGDTEWSQWIQSEKEQLAAVMERYGIEWEHLGTHEKHLSVLDYKKQEREKEVATDISVQYQALFQDLTARLLPYHSSILVPTTHQIQSVSARFSHQSAFGESL